MIRALLATLLLVVFAGAANAQPVNLARATAGYLYFNRPGASLAEHDSELVNCATVAHNNYIADAQAADNHPPQGIVGYLVTGGMLAGWQRAHFNIVVEHCMVVRGWRLVRLEPSVGAQLESLSREALATQLAPMIAAANPPGEIVGAWKNEAADPSTIFARSPENASRVLLSAIAANPEAASPRIPVAVARSGDLTYARVIEAVPVSEDLHPRADAALLIVGLEGPQSGSRHFVVELRNQHDQTIETVSLTYRGAERNGDRARNTLAFFVPAGEWSLSGFSINLNFCLGAPSFVANSGDVVFVGAFDSGSILRADSSPEAMSRFVPQALQSTAHPAQWTNGSTWACPPFNVYALEFEGAPFKPDYHWGSLAH